MRIVAQRRASTHRGDPPPRARAAADQRVHLVSITDSAFAGMTTRYDLNPATLEPTFRCPALNCTHHQPPSRRRAMTSTVLTRKDWLAASSCSRRRRSTRRATSWRGGGRPPGSHRKGLSIRDRQARLAGGPFRGVCSSSSTTSCSAPTTRRAARVARRSRTDSTAASSTSRITTKFWAVSSARLAKLQAFKRRMDWSFPGPRPAATSTSTSTSHSPRSRSARAITNTTTARRADVGRRRRIRRGRRDAAGTDAATFCASCPA